MAFIAALGFMPRRINAGISRFTKLRYVERLPLLPPRRFLRVLPFFLPRFLREGLIIAMRNVFTRIY